MWQQKQNNFTGLDELVSLPDETTANKTALWKRLEGKLQKKPQHAKLWWYWAAACLLFCATIPFLFIGGNNKSSVATIQKTPLDSNQIILLPIEQLKATVAIENMPFKNEINLPFVVKDIVSEKNNTRVIKVIKDSFIAVAPLQLENIPSVDLYVNVDTVATAIALTTNKKISVVHINELQEEDRVAEHNKNRARSLKRYRTKTADKTEYAGILTFRIYFKN